MIYNEIKKLYDSHVLPTYARQEVCFVRGKGSCLYDDTGKQYLDFSSGLGVSSIGHAHPQWVEAVTKQAAALVHTSNLYYTEPGALLAQRLCSLSGMDGVFFANSGAEANEGLIKAARKYSSDKYDNNRHFVVTLNRSFHGRTHTTLAATGQESLHKHFLPLTPGFIHADANDIDALKNIRESENVAAVLLEAVQGEGGVYPLSEEYVKAVAELCRERDWLLLFDEVQTGIGRCGEWFAYKLFGVQPDGVSFAKGIAGGFPMGGFLLGKKLSGVLTPGLHGSTFGGTPLGCAAALATLDILSGVIGDVGRKAKLLTDGIEAIMKNNKENPVLEIRGRGLMIGAAVKGDPKAYLSEALRRGLVCLTAGTDAIRLMPPLTIEDSEIEECLNILEQVFCP